MHFINYLEGKTLWTSPEILGQYMGAKLILGTKEPEYQADEEADRIFFKDKIVAYQL